ncbi:MAG: hypothetical protein LIO93_08550, partial [Bacteroidales bacterium]|nr:hypothetical protein [Bacteroidales bacterium]
MKIFITIICVFVGYMHISAQTGEIENEAERIPILSEFDILFSGITPEEYYKDYIPEIIPEYF